MKVGDTVKFKTGAMGIILHAYAPDSPGGFVDLLVSDGTLDTWSDGVISMSNGMLWDSAEVINESR